MPAVVKSDVRSQKLAIACVAKRPPVDADARHPLVAVPIVGPAQPLATDAIVSAAGDPEGG